MSVLSNFIHANEKYNQGISAIEHHHYLLANRKLTQSLRLNPKYTLAFINRGKLAQQHLHHNAAAISDYRHALRLDPHDNQTRYRLATLALVTGRDRLSADNFNRILFDVGWGTKAVAQPVVQEYQASQYHRAALDFQKLLAKLDFH